MRRQVRAVRRASGGVRSCAAGQPCATRCREQRSVAGAAKKRRRGMASSPLCSTDAPASATAADGAAVPWLSAPVPAGLLPVGRIACGRPIPGRSIALTAFTFRSEMPRLDRRTGAHRDLLRADAGRRMPRRCAAAAWPAPRSAANGRSWRGSVQRLRTAVPGAASDGARWAPPVAPPPLTEDAADHLPGRSPAAARGEPSGRAAHAFSLRPFPWTGAPALTLRRRSPSPLSTWRETVRWGRWSLAVKARSARRQGGGQVG